MSDFLLGLLIGMCSTGFVLIACTWLIVKPVATKMMKEAVLVGYKAGFVDGSTTKSNKTTRQ